MGKKNSDWKDLPENKSKPPCKGCGGSGRVGKDTCPSCGGFGY